jgi:hypothetical protein
MTLYCHPREGEDPVILVRFGFPCEGMTARDLFSTPSIYFPPKIRDQDRARRNHTARIPQAGLHHQNHHSAPMAFDHPFDGGFGGGIHSRDQTAQSV